MPNQREILGGLLLSSPYRMHLAAQRGKRVYFSGLWSQLKVKHWMPGLYFTGKGLRDSKTWDPLWFVFSRRIKVLFTEVFARAVLQVFVKAILHFQACCFYFFKSFKHFRATDKPYVWWFMCDKDVSKHSMKPLSLLLGKQVQTASLQRREREKLNSWPEFTHSSM